MGGLAWNRNRVVVRSVSFAADEIAAWKEETKSENAIEFMIEGSCCPTHTTFAAAIRFCDLDIVHVDPPPGQGLGLPLSSAQTLAIHLWNLGKTQGREQSIT